MVNGRLLSGFGLALLLCGILGCGRKPPKYNETVAGTAKLDGIPLAGVRVEFIPELAGVPNPPRSVGVTDDKGQFQLMCENDKPGAAIATHRVRVTRPRSDPKNPPVRSKGPIPSIPEVYTIISETPLQVEVTETQTTYDLNLTSNP
jgi:hypothetical protein